MTLSRADREWIRKQLQRSEERLRQHFDDAIRAEAQLAMLAAMTQHHPEKPAS